MASLNIFSCSWLDFFVLVLVVYLVYLNYKSCSYWKKRKIPYVPAPWIFSKTALSSFQLTYKNLEKIYQQSDNKVCVGFFKFRIPTLLLKSPQAITDICTKDFKIFMNKRYAESSEGNKDPLSQHLVALGGYKWAYLRSKLSPAFTPDKLKKMFPIFEKCVGNFMEGINNSLDRPIEVKDLCERLSMDSIASCAFGLELNCIKNENQTFIRMCSEPLKPGFWHNFISFVRLSYPRVFKTLRIMAHKKDVRTFFCSLVDQVIQLRKDYDRPYVDFVYILMKLLEEDEVKPEGSPFDIKFGELIASQVALFMVAGFKTTSLSMAYALFELARHQEVQKRLRDEIDSEIGNDDVTYDNLNSLKYLNCVIDEVLRMYPPVHFIERMNSERYQIPGTDYVIEEGTEVIISIRELHLDPAYFPRPMEFDPDRFGAANKGNIVKGSYLPFGYGPRHCIGSRFAQVEMKLALVNVVRDLELTLDDRTSSLTFHEYSKGYEVNHDVFLIFTKRVKK